MRIGILSMQKIPNYGSFLQALSLKMQFEARGHDVYFIDIVPGKQICEPTDNKTKLFRKIDRYFFKRIANLFFYKRMRVIHTEDHTRYLNTPKMLPTDQKYDLAVIGSDEVFNATIPSRWGFTTQLFGDIKNAQRVVSYAASCGSTTFEKADEFGIIKEISDSLNSLECISVRDTNTQDFVKKATGREALINVDPVFISDFDIFIPELKMRKPYMLIYAYGNRICDEDEIKAIKEYAKKHKIDIVSVGMQQRWCKHNITATAFELLSYVKGATCIVTDTFHGTVFSIKYNKQFVTLIRDSNRNKLDGLLRQFGLIERSVDDIDRFEKTLDAPIDYIAVNRVICSEQQKTHEYLDRITREV